MEVFVRARGSSVEHLVEATLPADVTAAQLASALAGHLGLPTEASDGSPISYVMRTDGGPISEGFFSEGAIARGGSITLEPVLAPSTSLAHIETADGNFISTLDAGRTVLGRSLDPEVTLRIDETGISRRHARLDVTHAGVSITDLGSRNGTRLDDEPIAEGTIWPQGALVLFGTVKLRLRWHPGSACPTCASGTPTWV